MTDKPLTGPMRQLRPYSHSGICVVDMEQSIAFYTKVFGFQITNRIEFQNQYQDLLRIKGDLTLRSVFLHQNGLTIELLDFAVPGNLGTTDIGPINQLGFVHLSFNVDSLEAAMADVQAHGGEVLADTRTSFDFGGVKGDIVMARDPNGCWLELMDFPMHIQHSVAAGQ